MELLGSSKELQGEQRSLPKLTYFHLTLNATPFYSLHSTDNLVCLAAGTTTAGLCPSERVLERTSLPRIFGKRAPVLPFAAVLAASTGTWPASGLPAPAFAQQPGTDPM
jgi:hypothetical protein